MENCTVPLDVSGHVTLMPLSVSILVGQFSPLVTGQMVADVWTKQVMKRNVSVRENKMKEF